MMPAQAPVTGAGALGVNASGTAGLEDPRRGGERLGGGAADRSEELSRIVVRPLCTGRACATSARSGSSRIQFFTTRWARSATTRDVRCLHAAPHRGMLGRAMRVC
jgi:hypothetical protein